MRRYLLTYVDMPRRAKACVTREALIEAGLLKPHDAPPPVSTEKCLTLRPGERAAFEAAALKGIWS